MCPLTRLSPRGLVQVPAKVRVVSTRSSSNSRRQCYWSQHHHITGMKLLLLGQWLTRTIGDIPHRILPSGAQEGGSLSQQTEGQAAAFYRMMMSSRSMFCCVLIPHAHLMRLTPTEMKVLSDSFQGRSLTRPQGAMALTYITQWRLGGHSQPKSTDWTAGTLSRTGLRSRRMF